MKSRSRLLLLPFPRSHPSRCARAHGRRDPGMAHEHFLPPSAGKLAPRVKMERTYVYVYVFVCRIYHRYIEIIYCLWTAPTWEGIRAIDYLPACVCVRARAFVYVAIRAVATQRSTASHRIAPVLE